MSIVTISTPTTTTRRPTPPYRLRAASRSDVGRVREHNEDAAFADAERGLFIVADGVGGHQAGEVASAIAVDVVRSSLDEARSHLVALAALSDSARREGVASVLGYAVRAAHHAVRRVARCEPDKLGMSTTIDVVLVMGAEVFSAHVGDTRTYLLRGGEAMQITRDHTIAQRLVDAGDLTPDEARRSPLRSVLVNAVGTRQDVVVDLTFVPVRAGDQLLLCSDGLHEYFATSEIAERVTWNDPELGLRELVEVACARGGHDNITGVLVDGLAARNHAVASHGLPTRLTGTPPTGVPVIDDDYDSLTLSGENHHEQY